MEVSRNLYILAATLLVLSLVSCAMTFAPNAAQPGMAGNGSVWKGTGLVLFLGALVAAFIANMTNLFEQVERRNEERLRKERSRRRP